MFQLAVESKNCSSVRDMAHVYDKSHFLPFSPHAVKDISNPVIAEAHAMFNQNCAINGHNYSFHNSINHRRSYWSTIQLQSLYHFDR